MVITTSPDTFSTTTPDTITTTSITTTTLDFLTTTTSIITSIALGPRYKVRESSSAAAARLAEGLRADYGFVATIDREIKHDLERDDIDEIYTRLDDEQIERQLMAGQLNMLYRDRRVHARTARLMEAEARIRPQDVGGDYKDAGGRSQEAKAVYRGTEAAEEASDSDDRVRETAGTRQRSCTARYTKGGW
ncbi:hypothetical protein Tco_1104933 [Tanacetum coccineum]